MRETIIQIIAEILKKEVADLQKELDTIDVWDSLKKVEVMFAIEEEYGIMFDEEDFPLMDTPNHFIELTEKKVNA